MIMEWSDEAKQFLESRREKLPGEAIEIDMAIERIRKDSEKAAAQAGASTVEKDHVREAITGLKKIEVTTEATEGSLAFVRVLLIMGAIFLVLGLVTELWWRNLERYGEQPEEGGEIFYLRYALWLGIALLAGGAVLLANSRRSSGEEWEEEEGFAEEGEEPEESEEAAGEEEAPEEEEET
jgi:hypothetical protein